MRRRRWLVAEIDDLIGRVDNLERRVAALEAGRPPIVRVGGPAVATRGGPRPRWRPHVASPAATRGS